MQLTRKQEEQLWRDLYLMADDNKIHCENAFEYGHIRDITSAKLHKKNIDNIKWYITCGMTISEIIKHCPLAKNVVDEINA